MQNFHKQKGFAFLAPIFAAFASFFSLIITFVTVTLAAYIFKIAVFLASLAVYLLTITALYLGIESCVHFMAGASPDLPAPVKTAASWVIPNNVSQFINCVLTIGFIEFAFKHKNKILTMAQRSAS